MYALQCIILYTVCHLHNMYEYTLYSVYTHIHTVMLHNGVWLIILYNVCNLYRIVCIFKFLHKPSVLLHSVCSFAHIYYLLCPINHDLRYFVAKFVCCNLRAFRCKFFLPKSCLCKENDKYQVWLFASDNVYNFQECQVSLA